MFRKSAVSINAKTDEPFKQIEFGFNIGYPQHCIIATQGGQLKPGFETALGAIKADGITHLRVQDPFSKKFRYFLQSKGNIMRYPDTTKKTIQDIISHGPPSNNGFNLLLCLSNVPPPQRDSCPPEELGGDSSWTNRWPPSNTNYDSVHWLEDTPGSVFDLNVMNLLNASFITEYNLYSFGSKNTNAAVNSDEFVGRLAELLYFTYSFGIDRVYFQKLWKNDVNVNPEDHDVNNPEDQVNPENQLGFFNIKGAPLPCYKYLQNVRAVVKHGYRVEKWKGPDHHYLDVIGPGLTLRYAIEHDDKSPPGAPMPSFKPPELFAKSDGLDVNSPTINPGEWVIWGIQVDQ